MGNCTSGGIPSDTDDGRPTGGSTSPTPTTTNKPTATSATTANSNTNPASLIRPAPPSILSVNREKKSKERPTASKYIAASSGSPKVGASIDGSQNVPPLTADGSAGALLTSPKGVPRQAHKRRSNRRSSEGKRLVIDSDLGANAVTNAALLIRTPTSGPVVNVIPVPELPRKFSDGHRRHGRERERDRAARKHSLKRRTSNNGMISRLALQFPLIRTSFLAVYRAFNRYMEIAQQAEEEVKRRSLRRGQHITVPLTKAQTESLTPAQGGRNEARVTDLQLVEEEGGQLMDLASVAEDEARKAEIKNILQTSGTPLLTTLPPQGETATNEVVSVKNLGSLTRSKLGEAIQAITCLPGSGTSDETGLKLTQDEIDKLFKLSDLDDSKSISFREFLIALAAGYFLKSDLEQLGDQHRAVILSGRSSARGLNSIGTNEGSTLHVDTRAHHRHTSSSPLGVDSQYQHVRIPSGQFLSAQMVPLPSDEVLPPPSPRVLQLTTDKDQTTQSTLAPHPHPYPTVVSPSRSSSSAPPSPLFIQTHHANTLDSPVHRPSQSPTTPTPVARIQSHLRKTPSPQPNSISHQPPHSVTSVVPILSLASPQHLEIQRGFRVVYQAFKDMDEDCSGMITHDELKHALFAATNLKNDAGVLEDRFRELDFDDSGEIGLNEFIYGVCSWVGINDAEEESTNTIPITTTTTTTAK